MRRPVAFTAARPPTGHLVLVDDVVTSGVTVLSAVRALREVTPPDYLRAGSSTISVLSATVGGTMEWRARTSPEEVA